MKKNIQANAVAIKKRGRKEKRKTGKRRNKKRDYQRTDKRKGKYTKSPLERTNKVRTPTIAPYTQKSKGKGLGTVYHNYFA